MPSFWRSPRLRMASTSRPSSRTSRRTASSPACPPAPAATSCSPPSSARRPTTSSSWVSRHCPGPAASRTGARRRPSWAPRAASSQLSHRLPRPRMPSLFSRVSWVSSRTSCPAPTTWASACATPARRSIPVSCSAAGARRSGTARPCLRSRCSTRVWTTFRRAFSTGCRTRSRPSRERWRSWCQAWISRMRARCTSGTWTAMPDRCPMTRPSRAA
mmetsp:Transcript_65135/g.212247  ORF Transcript_65135/g.212247 Transcript_65135/m.212247 type:complete len:216 (+) Transcript_65135:265-912(+)